MNYVRRPVITRRRRLTFPWWGWLVTGVVVILALLVGGVIVERATLKSVTFTVQDKAVTIKHTDNNTIDHQYMIYTDHGTYKDEDSLAFFKFNSADVYGQLQVGHTYTCRVTGFRIPILSSFNNIIDCKEAN